MIHSMTGYAAASVESPRGALAIELRSVNARFLDVQMRVAEELRWPGVLAEAPADEGATRAAAEGLCRRALDELLAARAREGAKLAQVVSERVAAMRRRLEEVAPLVPQSLAAYQAKLAERLREALGTADDDRVRAELAVFAAKVDVDEELERLRAHLAEAERTLERGGAVGK